MKIQNNEKFTKSMCELFDVEYTPSDETEYFMELEEHLPPWNKGLTLSDWHKELISSSTKGRVWTEERNKKVSQSKTKQWNDVNSTYNSKEFREKQSKKGKLAKKHMMKPVVGQHTDGRTLYAQSISEMCKLMNCGFTNIKRILDGTRKTHKGWKFYYGEGQQ